MTLRQVRRLVRLRRVHLDAVPRALEECHDTDSWREAARRILPSGVFDFLDGGAEQELTLAANRAAFESWWWLPRSLVDVTSVETTCELFGRQYAAPFALAPVGGTRFLHPDGELAAARAAAGSDVPYALSSMANTSVEEVTAACDGAWFQLYVQRDRSFSWAILERAQAAGCHVLEVTVDNPVTARRLRELRSGMTIPPALSLPAAASFVLHPRYCLRMLRADDLAFPNWLSEPREVDAFLAGSGPAFDAALTWAQIEKVRDLWSGRLVLKGPLSPQDAARARASGVDGVHLSNHGGRQLDRCVPTLEILPAVRDAVGEDYPIIIDSGIRSGGDIAVALALGADFVAVGRSYLYPLAVAGEEGVVLAIEQLTAQLRQTVALVGLSSVSELRAHGRNVLLRSRWTTCVLGGRGLNHRDIPPEDTR